MPRIFLNVPFDRKDEFKTLCRQESIPYFWDGENRSWGIEADSIPTSLQEFPPRSNRIHVIDCDYTYFPFASKAGAKWDSKRRVTVFRGPTVPVELTGFRPKIFSHQARMERELNGDKEKILTPAKEITPHKHQSSALNTILSAWKKRMPGFLLADETGLGKEQHIDSLVLTPTGWRKIGELAKGDKIIGGHSGKPQMVTGTFPQGNKPLYRITFDDQTSTLAGAEHLWCVRNDNDIRRKNGMWRTLTTSEIIDSGLFFGKKVKYPKWEIPLCPPLKGTKTPLPIHPYLLGTLLGNGGIIDNITISTRHKEQIKLLRKLIPEGLAIKGPAPSDLNKYRITHGNRHKTNPLTASLRKLKLLGKRDFEKTIPDIYANNTLENRLAFLQGLMDTDGTVKNARKRFSTSSETLAKQVVDLARGLGGWANYSTTAPRLPRTPRPNYILTIQLPEQTPYFRLAYHKKRATPSRVRIRKAIISIELETTAPAVCIALDDPKHLYITEGHSVTHNTISAWTAALAITKQEERPLKILIVGPLTALETWRETILWLGNGGAKGQANEITLINYDRLRNLFEEDEKKAKSLKGIAKFGTAESYDILLFDESHYLKSPTSARTKLARKLEENARFTFWISATAGQNPLELSYLSNLLGFLTGNKARTLEKDFEVWCQAQGINVKRGKFGKWVWDPTGGDNQKLHDILFAPKTAALRRRCSDIAGWPELQRIPKSHEFSPQETALYQTEWEEFLKALEEDRLLRLQGKKDTSKGIAQLGRLRQKASLLRVENTCDLAEEILENGYQIAISVEYLKTLDEIKANLEKRGYQVVEFSGRNTRDREECRQAYQKGEADVIIFSTESAISLHQEKDSDKPRAQINHDLRWSGIEQEQVDGRSHRNGRHAPVYWCFTKNTIEERVATILLEKLESMNTLRGDKDCSFSHIYREISQTNGQA